MDFGWAINALKAGNKVTRKGWNGKGMYLWLMPATTVKAEWCKEPVLKRLAEDNGGEIECLGTIRMYTHDSTGRKAVLTGWLASQSDMLAEDWDYACVSPEDEQRSCCCSSAIDKLPKLGSMENCKILSDAINNVLDAIGVMPHLTVTLVPGEDKELLISIEERSDHGASNFPLYAADVDGIIKTNIGSPVKSTRSVDGGYEVEDMKSSLSKED